MARRPSGPITRERILAAFPVVGRRFYSAAWIAEAVGCTLATAKAKLAELHKAGDLDRAEGPSWGHRGCPFQYRRV